MPTRLCLEPRCSNEQWYRGRCREHNRQLERGIRDPNIRRVYNSKRWKPVRTSQLFNHPLCERCGRLATEVHHRVDLADGGDPYTPSNLESLCRRCHSQETRRRQGSG